MTLKSQIADDVTAVFLNTDEFGDTVTHRPLGNSANDASVTAIWEEDPPQKMTSYGEELVRTGTLHVDDAITVNVKDEWVIDSELWQCTRATNKAEGGMKTVYLQRNDKEKRKGKGSLV